MPVFLAWILRVPALFWKATTKNPLAAILVLLLIGQQFQLWQGRRENTALRQTINTLRDDNARLNGSIRQLTEAVRTLKVGERAFAEIPPPRYIPYPVPGPLRVEYIRVPGGIETRLATITLPGKEIERVIETAPQSIIVDLKAKRDIKAGEEFRLVAVLVAPGTYQLILEPGAPVEGALRVRTPEASIPAPTQEPSRWTFALLVGPEFSGGTTLLSRAEIEYRLTPATVRLQQFTRLEADWRWNGAGASGRLLYGLRF